MKERVSFECERKVTATHQSGHLIAERFPSAGRHEAQGILAVHEQAADDLQVVCELRAVAL